MKRVITLISAVGAAAKAIRGGTDVAANAQKIADIAAQIPVVFETNEITGDSEALPAIWENWDDFLVKGTGLETLARPAALATKATKNRTRAFSKSGLQIRTG